MIIWCVMQSVKKYNFTVLTVNYTVINGFYSQKSYIWQFFTVKRQNVTLNHLTFLQCNYAELLSYNFILILKEHCFILFIFFLCNSILLLPVISVFPVVREKDLQPICWSWPNIREPLTESDMIMKLLIWLSNVSLCSAFLNTKNSPIRASKPDSFPLIFCDC